MESPILNPGILPLNVLFSVFNCEMMNNDISEILFRIEHIEIRPSMYGLTDSYESVACFISGYFLGLDTSLKMDLNKRFADWILEKNKRPASSWHECILLFMAENDEVRAREILFSELKAFLNSLIKEDN